MKEVTKENTILIHFESLSLDIFYNNQELFPNLKKLISRSRFYTKAYSTSTSTIMVLADILYTNMTLFESAENIYEIKNISHSNNFFNGLKGEKKIIFYPGWLGEDRKCLEYLFDNKISFQTSFLEFLASIRKEITENERFCMFIYCGMSGISYLHDNEGVCWNDKWKNGYRKSDEVIGHVWNFLKEKNMLKSTKIIVFGDHGDDFWCHGFNNGYCHGIEPYSNMINVPLILYGNGIIPEENYDLISLMNIKELILDKKVYYTKETMVYARNIYCNQKPEEGGLIKSYALTDGEYFILYSCRGFEFYYLPHDSKCESNLLDFFVLNKNGALALRPELVNHENKHLRKAMPKQRQKEILNAFSNFKRKLIRKIVENSCKFAGGGN